MSFDFYKYNEKDTSSINLTYVNMSVLTMIETDNVDNDDYCSRAFTIRKSRNIVGFIQFSVFKVERVIVNIDLFEVVDKGKGTGLDIMNQIKNELKVLGYNKIKCEPKGPKAFNFFINKCNFNFRDDACYLDL